MHINSLSVLLFFSGCKEKSMGLLLKEIFQTPYFRIVVVEDDETVELCGALKVIGGRNICSSI